MPNSSLSYPRIRKHKDGRNFIDFNLNSRRYRLFNGKRIGSSLSPNTYPLKLRRIKTIELADEVYRYLISNNYSFEKQLDDVGLFDSIVSKKLSEPLSQNYYKCLCGIVFKLRNELVVKGYISVDFIDSISLKNTNNTSRYCTFIQIRLDTIV